MDTDKRFVVVVSHGVTSKISTESASPNQPRFLCAFLRGDEFPPLSLAARGRDAGSLAVRKEAIHLAQGSLSLDHLKRAVRAKGDER
ncbi:hypothetical protein [Burkholderia pseudomallei]|uniref:hypothetical protein n=1 Tax=Burkholderia pseudomallei TaxID=28450 RepID=UPI001009A120|nr:hypothetical protein [Burkholderia pseudomallei]